MSDAMITIEEKNKQRKSRINRLKKLIVGTIVIAILFPTIMSFLDGKVKFVAKAGKGIK